MQTRTNQFPKHNLGTIGKIIITEDLENIINTLHSNIGSTEWSGVLFYNLTKGSITKLKDLEFTADFMYPMNVGNSAYTEFKYDGKLMDAYDIKEDLIAYETGMIHTHHNMNAFFSGVDIDELITNAEQFNYYISLVVNFAKSYVCKIIFPSKSTINKTYSITDQDGKLIEINTKEEVTEYLEGDLTIEFKNKKNEEPWLFNRIKVLKAAKTKTASLAKTQQDWKSPITVHQERSLFEEQEQDYWGWEGPKAKTEITIKNFLSAMLSLDSSKLNEDIPKLLKELVELNEADCEEYVAMIDTNIEIFYANLYPEDNIFSKFIQRCKQVAGVLSEYKEYEDTEFIKKLNIVLS